MNKSMPVGITSMGGYLPGKDFPKNKLKSFADFLRKETLLHPDYIKLLEESGKYPGKKETNYDGWESKPWFEEWVKSLPANKQAEPFQGAVERCRVPMDPESVKKSIHPHPMLASDAETFVGALAIFNGNVNKDDIDLVICHSLVPDLSVPQNASLVQHKLGLKNAGAYNVDTCCSSFITMTEIATALVNSGIKKKVLVVGSALDSIINDKSTYYSVYIGDGAVAAIIEPVAEGYGYLGSNSQSHGERHKGIIFKKRKPNLLIETSQGSTFEQEFVTFNDPVALKAIAKEAKNDVRSVSLPLLKKLGMTADDIDFMITHQPVPWTPSVWCEALGVPKEKMYHSFEKYGNIAVASSATNLLEAVEQGLIKAGDKVLMVSSGVGENHIVYIQIITPQFIANNCLCEK